MLSWSLVGSYSFFIYPNKTSEQSWLYRCIADGHFAVLMLVARRSTCAISGVTKRAKDSWLFSRSYNKQSWDRPRQETSPVLWRKGLELTDVAIPRYDSHRSGLFLFIYFKMYPLRITPEKLTQSEKWKTAPLMSSDWIWSLPDSEEGRRWLLSVSLQIPDEPRYTWIMHEVNFSYNFFKLSCDYLSLIKNLCHL